MSPKHTHEVGAYFNTNWQRYKDSVNKNMLYHLEMYTALNQFLQDHIGERPFSFVDIGCGDGSSIEPVLAEKSIQQYIGIDAAEDILEIAASNLERLNCEKKLILGDMIQAINQLPLPVDIIFSSYAIHHLSSQEKFDFIKACKDKLLPGGYFLMIDVIREENQTRDEWLDAMEARFTLFNPDLPQDDIKSRMIHPRAADYPENILTFETFSRDHEWRSFQILVKKNMYAFMVFEK